MQDQKLVDLWKKIQQRQPVPTSMLSLSSTTQQEITAAPKTTPYPSQKTKPADIQLTSTASPTVPAPNLLSRHSTPIETHELQKPKPAHLSIPGENFTQQAKSLPFASSDLKLPPVQSQEIVDLSSSIKQLPSPSPIPGFNDLSPTSFLGKQPEQSLSTPNFLHPSIELNKPAVPPTKSPTANTLATTTSNLRSATSDKPFTSLTTANPVNVNSISLPSLPSLGSSLQMPSPGAFPNLNSNQSNSTFKPLQVQGTLTLKTDGTVMMEATGMGSVSL